MYDSNTQTTVLEKKYRDYTKAAENAEKLSQKYSDHYVFLFLVNMYGTHVTRKEWKNGAHDESKNRTWRIGY